MTISELIEVLEKIKKRHGDILVEYAYFELVGIAKRGSPNNGGLCFKFNLRDIKK